MSDPPPLDLKSMHHWMNEAFAKHSVLPYTDLQRLAAYMAQLLDRLAQAEAERDALRQQVAAAEARADDEYHHVEQLRELLQRLHIQPIEGLVIERDKARKQVATMREALAYYADPEQWMVVDDDVWTGIAWNGEEDHPTDRARAALAAASQDGRRDA